MQVMLGRIAIIVSTVLGIGAAYLVYKTPDGLYKYLQTISIYLVMPIVPAIIIGVLSKRVTLAGATASVLTGIVLASLFVTDQLLGPEAGAKIFPFLHHKLTLNYTYRGLLGTLVVVAVMFIVSSFTKKTDSDKLEKTTINWSRKMESFTGWSDWRLQLAGLTVITIILYTWLW